MSALGTVDSTAFNWPVLAVAVLVVDMNTGES